MAAVAPSVEVWVRVSAPVLTEQAAAFADEIRSTAQVLAQGSEQASAGERAAWWQAASSVWFLVDPGCQASAAGLAAWWQVAWCRWSEAGSFQLASCHWSEADLCRDGRASPGPDGLVFPSAGLVFQTADLAFPSVALLAAWLNLAASAWA